MSEPPEQPTYVCHGCGAALEVRVGFKGKVVWTLPADSPDFGNTEPELRGRYQDPKLVCSADVLHTTGFKLVDGEIEPAET